MTAHGTFWREEDHFSSTNDMKGSRWGGALGNEEASEILEQETIWLDTEVPELWKAAFLLESLEQSEVPGRQSPSVSRWVWCCGLGVAWPCSYGFSLSESQPALWGIAKMGTISWCYLISRTLERWLELNKPIKMEPLWLNSWGSANWERNARHMDEHAMWYLALPWNSASKTAITRYRPWPWTRTMTNRNLSNNIPTGGITF